MSLTIPYYQKALRPRKLRDTLYQDGLDDVLEAYLGNDEKKWLIEQNRTATGLNWFLEIESSSATKCTVDYSNSNKVDFDEDRKISFLSGGSCLRPAQGGYWLEISSECYDEEFTISCDQSFLTTLLFQRDWILRSYQVLITPKLQTHC